MDYKPEYLLSEHVLILPHDISATEAINLIRAFRAPPSGAITIDAKMPLDEAKRLEEIVQTALEAWDANLKAIAFIQLLAEGWDRDRAHKVKLGLGLTK